MDTTTTYTVEDAPKTDEGTIVIVDADGMAWRAAITAEQGRGDVEAEVDGTQDYLTEVVGAVSPRVVLLSGPATNNYRYEAFPEYKIKRPKERPVYLQEAREVLIQKYGAIVAETAEADDACGILACRSDEPGNTVVVTYDKDLLQVPGLTYRLSPRKREVAVTSQSIAGANRYFALQMLVGDTSDCVPGLHGIGPKKAEKYLQGWELSDFANLAVTMQIVWMAYRGALPTKATQYPGKLDARAMATCLWVQRHPDATGADVWDNWFDKRDMDWRGVHHATPS